MVSYIASFSMWRRLVIGAVAWSVVVGFAGVGVASSALMKKTVSFPAAMQRAMIRRQWAWQQFSTSRRPFSSEVPARRSPLGGVTPAAQGTQHDIPKNWYDHITELSPDLIRRHARERHDLWHFPSWWQKPSFKSPQRGPHDDVKEHTAISEQPQGAVECAPAVRTTELEAAQNQQQLEYFLSLRAALAEEKATDGFRKESDLASIIADASNAEMQKLLPSYIATLLQQAGSSRHAGKLNAFLEHVPSAIVDRGNQLLKQRGERYFEMILASIGAYKNPVLPPAKTFEQYLQANKEYEENAAFLSEWGFSSSAERLAALSDAQFTQALGDMAEKYGKARARESALYGQIYDYEKKQYGHYDKTTEVSPIATFSQYDAIAEKVGALENRQRTLDRQIRCLLLWSNLPLDHKGLHTAIAPLLEERYKINKDIRDYNRAGYAFREAHPEAFE